MWCRLARSLTSRTMRRTAWTVAFVLCFAGVAFGQTPAPLVQPAEIVAGLEEQLDAALVRLPLAAVLGAMLALRPRRRGTTERSMPRS